VNIVAACPKVEPITPNTSLLIEVEVVFSECEMANPFSIPSLSCTDFTISPFRTGDVPLVNIPSRSSKAEISIGLYVNITRVATIAIPISASIKTLILPYLSAKRVKSSLPDK